MMKTVLFCTCLLAFSQLTAQIHSDYATALTICSKQGLHIDSVQGSGLDKTEMNQATCFLNGLPTNVEVNSCWIRFTVSQSGNLYFIITPDFASDDLDFALFQIGDPATGQGKQLLRCMAAGGFSSVDSLCLGPTGLLPTETDTLADAGCGDPGDNNFLAPIGLLAGETYALCIQNFTTFHGFSIAFCGTAMLGCETDICTFLNTSHSPMPLSYRLHRLYPNPVSLSSFTLDLETENAENMTFTLVNILGQPVRQIQRFVPAGRENLEFPVENLPTGTYWLQMTNGEASTTRQVVISHSY